MILRARLVLPISREPIEDGAVAVRRGKIAAVGRWRDLRAGPGKKLELGDVLLAPGLINAHCHLDYTDMAGMLPPTRLFTDWLKSIVTLKADWTRRDYLQSWKNGAEMLLRTGTTTVADMEAVPELLPEVWDATRLRVISFVEMIGFTSRRPVPVVLEEALSVLKAHPSRRDRLGLSPHAPYSTVPELLRRAIHAAHRRQVPISTHVAESAAEFEMFRHGRGEMFYWLQKSARNMSDCGLGSPIMHMARNASLSPRMLLVHVNYLAPGDAQEIAANGTSVVHCPRSHAYFRHAQFPLRRLARAGVNICLGTDSLISVLRRRREPVELNLFDEMRALSQTHGLSPQRVVEMATVNGARALGRIGKLGEISQGASADLIAIPFNGKRRGCFEAMLAHQGTVSDSMIAGDWVYGRVAAAEGTLA